MTKMFENLMTGLDEVDAFLDGEAAGYKANLPAEIDVKGASPAGILTQTSEDRH